MTRFPAGFTSTANGYPQTGVQNNTQQSANGHLADTTQAVTGTSAVCFATCPSDWDARSGALLGPNPRGDSGYAAIGGGTTTYDVRGQLASTVQTSLPTQQGSTCTYTTKVTNSYYYDVEGRTTGKEASTVLSPKYLGKLCTPEVSGPTEGYTWGPNDHVVQAVDDLNNPPYTRANTALQDTETLHWDGDELAFTSYTSVEQMEGGSTYSGIDQILIGDFAVYTPASTASSAPMLVNPFSSLIVTPRDETGANVVLTSPAFMPQCAPAQTYPMATLNQPIYSVHICQPRSDGYTIGLTTFQGVRAYDPGSAQWTTPDAYAGDVDDPMSQQKYMWNGNNPIAYSDPSGYEPVCDWTPQGCASGDGNGLRDVYNFLIGDDLRTLRDPKAGAGAKVFAGLMITSNFFDAGPAVKVIGRMADLAHVERGVTLLDKLPDLGSEALNRAQNVKVVQGEMAKGTEFVDLTYNRTGSLTKDVPANSFLQTERDTLMRGGYKFDFDRGVWFKPQQR